jgi:hypothetical protein
LEGEGKILDAYVQFKVLKDIDPNDNIGKQAANSLGEIKRGLERRLRGFVQEQRWEEMARERPLVEKILPELLGEFEPHMQKARQQVAEVGKKWQQVKREAEQLCQSKDFPGAVELYEKSLEEFRASPELCANLTQELAGVYYKWGDTLYQEYKTTSLDIGPSSSPAPARSKLERCLEVAPDGSYAKKAQRLLKKLPKSD